MRPFTLLILHCAFICFAAHADARVAAEQSKAPRAQWELDHYLYDASLHREWEVLVDCVHPDAPARMELVPFNKQREHAESAHIGRAVVPGDAKGNDASRRGFARVTIRAGDLVAVSNASQSSVRIAMHGTAMQTASFGEKIRVRLSPSGRFLSGIVCGPHLVELDAPAKPSWGKQ